MLAARTKTAYRRRVRELVNELAGVGELESFVKAEAGDDRRAVIADWRRRLVDRRLTPSTINVALAAATSPLVSRGLRAPVVRRVGPEPRAPRSLSREQLRALQRETDRVGIESRSGAAGLLMLTGLRIGGWPDWTPMACVLRSARASW